MIKRNHGFVFELTGIKEKPAACDPPCEREYCGGCAAAECPHRDSLHRHHDGCPSCAELGEV